MRCAFYTEAMNKAQTRFFVGMSFIMAFVVATAVFTTEAVSEASIVTIIAATLLCCAAIYYWIKSNSDDVDIMLSDNPKWLVWGKNKHGFWVFSAGVIAWAAMLLDEYLKTGGISIHRLTGFILAALLLLMFYREARKIAEVDE